MLTRYRPGDRVRVELLRNGNPRQVMVTLGSLTRLTGFRPGRFLP